MTRRLSDAELAELEHAEIRCPFDQSPTLREWSGPGGERRRCGRCGLVMVLPRTPLSRALARRELGW